MTTALEAMTKGLVYISETDAAVIPFTGGTSPAVTAEEILRHTGQGADTTVETITAADFFDRLTKVKDWFGDTEIKRARQYAELRAELERTLIGLTVFKVGRVQIDLYIVGLDEDGRLAGVRTKAVET